MHLIVVGDEVVDCVRAQGREEEVIGPVVTLGIYCPKNILYMLDAGRIAEFLILGQQYLARDPARRARVSGEFPNRLGVDQEMEAERGGALNNLYSERSIALQVCRAGRFKRDQYVGIEEKTLHRSEGRPSPEDSSPEPTLACNILGWVLGRGTSAIYVLRRRHHDVVTVDGMVVCWGDTEYEVSPFRL